MSYKRYKSAAHNFARSFASTLNWVGDDYAMSYLARAALRTGIPELQADLISGAASPPDLASDPVLESIQGRVAWFPSHLEAEGADPAKVREAKLTIRFEIQKHQFLQRFGGALSVPFSAEVRVLDDRGIQHVGEYRDSWVAEPWEPAPRRRRWWQFWRRAA
jgi:hypothetical protein